MECKDIGADIATGVKYAEFSAMFDDSDSCLSCDEEMLCSLLVETEVPGAVAAPVPEMPEAMPLEAAQAPPSTGETASWASQAQVGPTSQNVFFLFGSCSREDERLSGRAAIAEFLRHDEADINKAEELVERLLRLSQRTERFWFGERVAVVRQNISGSWRRIEDRVLMFPQRETQFRAFASQLQVRYYIALSR